MKGAARAAGPRNGKRMPRVPKGRPGSNSGTGERRTDAALVLGRALGERQNVFLAQLARCQKRANEPAIHDLRVAIRRLIATLRLADVVLPDEAITKHRRMLRSTLREFNALRDVHISLLAMNDLQRRIPPASSYVKVLRLRERTVLRDAARQLKLVKTRGIETAITEIQQSLLKISADPILRPAARTMMLGAYAQSFSRVVRARQAVRADDPSTIHRLRVAFKRLRYMSEVLQPLLPWLNARRRKAMHAYQTAMGEIQDLEVLTGGVRAFASSMPLTSRLSMLTVQEALFLRRKEKIDAFLRTADAVEMFWSDPE